MTDPLEHDVALEDVQYLTSRADSLATRLHDWRRRTVMRNVVERISINVGEEEGVADDAATTTS